MARGFSFGAPKPKPLHERVLVQRPTVVEFCRDYPESEWHIVTDGAETALCGEGPGKAFWADTTVDAERPKMDGGLCRYCKMQKRW